MWFAARAANTNFQQTSAKIFASHRRTTRTMPKISQNRKVNKSSQSHLVAKISKFQNSKMEFFISPTIPENMNALGGTIKTQWAIVSFEKIR